jgi:putative toxin-antitoxin system antitoxin component (TIGR02293 family)
MVPLTKVVLALGGSQFLESIGLSERDLSEETLIGQIRSGLRYSALDALASRFSLNTTELLQILRVPPRTLARRKKSQELAADESDRLVRLARIAALAEQTHGNPVRAGRWLREPNSALGDSVAPIHWLDTDLGAREVEEILIRIAHGVYS